MVDERMTRDQVHKEDVMDWQGGMERLRRDAALVVDALLVVSLWLVLSAQAMGPWLVGRLMARPRRQPAQATIEIIIAMAVLGVLALGVWKIIGPTVLNRATGISTDLQNAGTGTTGTGT